LAENYRIAIVTAEKPELLTTAEVAKLLRVSQSTVQRWISLGQLPAIRLPSGGFRIRREAVERLLREDQGS
jgi:excisionase family DNA binding protein